MLTSPLLERAGNVQPFDPSRCNSDPKYLDQFMDDLNVIQEIIVAAAVLNSPDLPYWIKHYRHVTRGDVGNVGNIFPSNSLNEFWSSIMINQPPLDYGNLHRLAVKFVRYGGTY